jgi:hypothetical protein
MPGRAGQGHGIAVDSALSAPSNPHPVHPGEALGVVAGKRPRGPTDCRRQSD